MNQIETPFPALKTNRKKALATKILVKSVVYSFALFGLLFIVLLLFVLNMLRQDDFVAAEVPDKAILVVDFNENYPETRSDDLFTEFSGIPSLSFYDLIKAINLAALDPKVKAFVGNVSVSGLGMAQIGDLREAVKVFRSTGKKAYLYSTGFGSFGQGMREYYLATAFDEIWMQPTTEVGITGVSIEVPFVRGLLDKFGIRPEFYARHEYKNAAASLLNKEFSKEYRSEMKKLGGGIFEKMVEGMAEARGIKKSEIEKAVDDAPITAEKALDLKLIDKIAYKPDLIEQVMNDTNAEMVNVLDYALSIKEGKKNRPTVALMVLDGMITEGESVSSPLQGEAVVGADTIARQLDEIAQDENVKALVLRVNSPGGSYTASNEIWYAIMRLKKQKMIPVVVSMGDYAASGGYFVALAGDYIIAEPLTITGSIGVLGGKMVLSELWKKLDINWGEIKFGKNAGILSSNHVFTPAEKAIFNRSLDNIYKDFTEKTATIRDINPNEMDRLARGRVWLGQDAVDKKLVDALGGINAAVAKAKELGGIEPKTRFNISYYPRRRSFQEKLAQMLGNGPKISVNKVANDFGFEANDISMLKRMKYETVLPPFKIVY